MTDFKTGSRARSGLREKLRHMFRERELILRSEGQVRYLRIGTRVQATAAVFALGLGMWLCGANGYAYYQDLFIEEQQTEIVEARVAYETLRGEMHAYQAKIAALAGEVLRSNGETGEPVSVTLDALAEVTAGIESAFDQVNRDLDLTQADRKRIIQSRDALHEKIAALELALSNAQDRITVLDDNLDERDETIEGRIQDIAELTENRDSWRQRAEGLQAKLESAQNRIASLEGDLDTTTAALSVERNRVEDLSDIRARLADQVASLENGLSQAEVRGERLSSRVAQLTVSLDTVQHERMAVDGERQTLAADLAVVEAELSLHQSATDRTRERLEAVVKQLSELTDTDAPVDPNDSGAVQAIETQIAELSSELRGARNTAADMESAIGDVVVGLARVAGDSPDRLLDLKEPTAKVGLTRELLTAVSSVQDDQLALIDRLTEETDQGISRNEEILKMAGLDVETMLRISGFEPGMGGPLIPDDGTVQVASGPQEGAAALSAGVGVLESRLSRMDALNELMRCTPLISPVDNYQLTSPFGYRKDPITGQKAYHKGIDIGGWAGIKVHATAPGTVVYAGKNSGYGFMVRIDHGCGIVTTYAHLRRIKVKVGQKLDHRAVVGTLGSTGRSTGPHVHYEVLVDGKALDPELFIKAGRYVLKI